MIYKSQSLHSALGNASYHCRQHPLQHCAQNIEHIAEEPDDDELDRESVSRAALEVLNDLWREDDNWTGISDGIGEDLGEMAYPSRQSIWNCREETMLAWYEQIEHFG